MFAFIGSALFLIVVFFVIKYAYCTKGACNRSEKKAHIKTICKPSDATDEKIRQTAYMIAAADNFSKNPEHYWCAAEKQLKGNNHD